MVSHLSKLQQYLPFTVLKLNLIINSKTSWNKLQQYLPFTVLKPMKIIPRLFGYRSVATVLTVYGIETLDQVYGADVEL